jgi:hypothetical protein
VEIPVNKNKEDPTGPMTENSLSVYVKDSFKMDFIPFDGVEILEEVTSEDIKLEYNST